jgi:CubicO group peptidase (beta-lactamase class C family)
MNEDAVGLDSLRQYSELRWPRVLVIEAMLKRSVVGVVGIGLLACVSMRAATQDEDASIALFERYVESLRRATHVPGVSGIIIRDGRTIWLKGLGFQDLESRVAATPDTLYDIASLTKTFTSTLLLQCVERRTLSLDEPMSRYTTAIPEANATVRHVLTHTSQGSPGAVFRYDGNRFSALTAVVDACHDKLFRLALADLLDRSAMISSVPGHDLEQPPAAIASLFDRSTLARYATAVRRLASPYQTKGRSVVRAEFPPRDINASAGLLSSVIDLAKYDAAIDAHLFIGADSQALAWTNARSSSTSLELPYGLGWFIQTIHGVRVVWHYGQWSQYSALYIKLPERHLTLILLANSGGLGEAFPLATGNVMVSPFARVFLGLFI